MHTTQSADGTTIAFDRTGSGPALVLVVGAFCNRFTTKSVSPSLASDFTVYEYDRRGRGDSGDSDAYAIEREVEDLAAIAEAAGGAPFVYGHSSGAALALEAASRGLEMRKLVTYEPPYTGSNGNTSAFAQTLRELVRAGHPDEAAERFLALTGAPEATIEQVKASPYWPNLVGLAHTLPYDVTLGNEGIVPSERLTTITAPVLALAGGASPAWAFDGALAIASAVPDAEYRVLNGQDHNIADDVLVSVLTEYFV
jgi:pimeloyl-ACP methyl ester carboxylesterase